jgi:hypothetical protein
MIDISLIEKNNVKLSREFYNNMFYFVIYFCLLSYLFGYLEKNTKRDNSLTIMENVFMKYIFAIFIIYFVVYLLTKISSWNHKLLVFVFSVFLSMMYIYYSNVDSSIMSRGFIVPLIIFVILFNIIIYVSFIRRNTLDRIQANLVVFNESYEKVLSNLLYSLTVVMIIYVIVFRQYNYNTPSSNTIQPMILGIIVMVSLFYFIAKFVIQIGMVKRYNVTNVMISLYLIFSIFVAFYLYTFIKSLEKLSKDSPESALKSDMEDAKFKSQPYVVQFIKNNILIILLICIILLYYIRDSVYWNRYYALGYFVLTIMLFYTSKVVSDVKSGFGGFLSAVYFVEWLLVTKLRWNNVMNLFNIIFSGIESSNKDLKTSPSLIISS